MLQEFTQEELELLTQDGYIPGYMMDVREGDLVAIAPTWRETLDGTTVPVKTLVVQRVIKSDASYHDESNMLVPHTIVNFIGMTIDNLPIHESYSNMYPCFIKRAE